MIRQNDQAQLAFAVGRAAMRAAMCRSIAGTGVSDQSLKRRRAGAPTRRGGAMGFAPDDMTAARCGDIRDKTSPSEDPRGEMSAHGWLLLISSVDSVVAAGTLILIMVLRRWAGVYFAIALAAAVVLILSLTILLRALGLA